MSSMLSPAPPPPTDDEATAPGPQPRAGRAARRTDPVAAVVSRSTQRPWLVLLVGLLVVAAAAFGLSQGIRTMNGSRLMPY